MKSDKSKLSEVVQALQLVLDSVDYTSGACTVFEMVGAVLPKEIIITARKALKNANPPN